MNVELLHTFDRPVPRYTSYPTAPVWKELEDVVYTERLEGLGEEPISVYVHVPFCKTMCLYCGCSVVLNRKEENEKKYVDYLIKEIELVARKIPNRKVAQMHFGGGTPTKLSESLLQRLFEKLSSSFTFSKESEIAIEVDPRTVFEDDGKKLSFLRSLGFNRISFGVQDTNPKVQEAVKRRQSLEMTEKTFYKARDLQFQSINIDLIYGLPYQTKETFQETVRHILHMRPDRIALFSYAQIPDLKPHQKAIRKDALPTTEEKFQIYLSARSKFVEAGYIPIGMDHFAHHTDELALAYDKKTLSRNFQGYTVLKTDTLLGLGVTSIGQMKGAYFQNVKTLDEYYSKLDQGLHPIYRGCILSQDDLIRQYVIQTLMCTFHIDKAAFQNRFGLDFDSYFQVDLDFYEQMGLLRNTEQLLQVSSTGELFIRNIASCFDAYYKPQAYQFSKGI